MAKVLKNNKKEITEEEKEEIIKELEESNKVSPGQSITYEEFLILYEAYKDRMSEVEFADILGIGYFNYNNMKNRGTRAKILKNNKKGISEEEKNEIIEEILASNKVSPGQSITYEEFLILYEAYKDRMRETEFAEILGISYYNYQSMKYKGTKAKVLKSNKKEILEEEKEEIIKELEESNKVSSGQSITYEEFLILYEAYKDRMSEVEFADILGIGYPNYKNMKYKGTKAKVQDYQLKAKIDRIGYILKKESRYYTKQELEKLSKENDIAIDTIIKYCWCNGSEKYVQVMKDLLEKEEKIYIGNVKCSQQFANKHSKTMIDNAKKSSIVLCTKYNCKNMIQDFASDALEYVLEKCGDIEKNFENDDEIAKNVIGARIYLNIKYKCLRYLKKPKEFSFHREFTYKGNREEANVFDRGIEDKSINVEKEVEEKVLNKIKKKHEKKPEEACIELLMKNIEIGLAREEAIKRTGEILGISPNEMLKSLQKYMIEKKKVRKTHDGEFVLGE